MVSWSILKSVFAQKNVSINETELSITLDNGAKIELKGADRGEDSLRGVSVNMVVMDEYAFMKENVWGGSHTTNFSRNTKEQHYLLVHQVD